MLWFVLFHSPYIIHSTAYILETCVDFLSPALTAHFYQTHSEKKENRPLFQLLNIYNEVADRYQRGGMQRLNSIDTY